MSNLNIENKEEIEKILDEILEKNISVDSFQEIASRSLENEEFNKVNTMLLEYYNKKVGYDFESSLKQQLKLMVNEKMLSKLDNVNDLEKSKEDKINEVANEENVDKDTLEKASKKINENDKSKKDQKSNTKDYDFRAELMIQVYIEEFKRYSELLYDLKERQAYNRELTIGDKQGTQLVLYERYLMNLENSYSGYANLNKIEDRNLNENEDIKKLKEKLAYDLGKKEDYIDSKVNIRLNNFRDMHQKRQEIAKKILEITDDKSLQQDPLDFKKQMDYYQEEYRKITYEMRILDPTLEEYQEMIKLENENKEFAKANISENSEIGFSSGYSDEQIDVDNKQKNTSSESRAINIKYEDDIILKNSLKDIISKISICINQDYNYDKAEEYLQSAEDMLGIYENEKKEAKNEQKKVSNEKLDKYMDKNISGKSNEEITKEEKNAKDPLNYEDPYTVRKECNNTKIQKNNLNKKLELKERLKKVQNKYNELYKDNKEYEKDNNNLIIR